jgi:hypothetical protein
MKKNQAQADLTHSSHWPVILGRMSSSWKPKPNSNDGEPRACKATVTDAIHVRTCLACSLWWQETTCFMLSFNPVDAVNLNVNSIYGQ